MAIPIKAAKQHEPRSLATGNSSVPVLTDLPEGWMADAVMIDAMFTINTTPLKHTLNTSAYAKTLLNHFVVLYFKRGASEVHRVWSVVGILHSGEVDMPLGR